MRDALFTRCYFDQKIIYSIVRTTSLLLCGTLLPPSPALFRRGSGGRVGWICWFIECIIAADLQDNFAAVRGSLRCSWLGVGGRVGFLGWLTSSLFNRLG